ncbi:MAG: DCC1-like thiol-disulfide oxidoreductase family protein [Prolixibacteraceae bacterium]|nr:DCC1-like thiol-disulfide oxidoreductase family protein [Prolixibacteraceae bacterium]
MEYPDYIILFDGVCNLCSSSVQFVMKHDKKRLFRFAPLQWDVASKILGPHKHILHFDTLILIEKGKVYDQSTAALKIARHLRFFRIFYFLIILPVWMRDPVYRFVARYRYRVFGKKEHCMVPAENKKELFIGWED